MLPVHSMKEIAGFRQVDLFGAGLDGYATYRIPGLLATPAGSLIAWCEGRRNDHLDWGDIDLLVRRSDDGGDAWQPPQLLIAGGGLPVHNGVMVADSVGTVHLIYCLNYERCFHRHSSDDGRRFSQAVEITNVFGRFSANYDWNVLATGPGHATCLENGRLVVPIWLSTGGRTHRPSRIATIYSDDNGRTWQAGELAPDNVRNMSESAVVQLSDGSVMLNIRNESPQRRRAISVSPDGATHWTTPRFDPALREPACMASMLRADLDGRHGILFANPDTLQPSRDSEAAAAGVTERANLTVRVSYDDGATWPVARTIDPDLSAYSDLATGVDGRIHLFFERGGTEANVFVTAALSLASFSLAWLEAS